MKNKCFLYLILFLFSVPGIDAQPINKRLTLHEVIDLAREQSPRALLAKHTFRASYWQYRSFSAGLLPNMYFNSTMPNLNRSFDRITLPDGTDAFVERKLMTTSAELFLSQNIPFTGGNVFLESNLQRIDIFGPNEDISYLSTPVSIGFRQPISSFNNYKWEAKIEPLKYEEAKKNYISSLEEVSIQAVELFFDLSMAQLNLNIANVNFSNADTLYKISQGRYNIGTIAQNELLQMELSLLNAGTALNEAKIDLEMKKFRLRSFLGFNEQVEIELVIPGKLPAANIDFDEAYALAIENNPRVINYEVQLAEAGKNLARAKAEKGLNANMFASFGLTKRADEFSNAYLDPSDQQHLRVGIEFPILDWGMGRGRYKMAQSKQEMVKTQVEQAKTDFKQNVFLQVTRFNLQDEQVQIAAKADTVAQLRYDVTKHRFMIGKINVLDLNVALNEKDVAKRAYLQSLYTYWHYYFNIRNLTLHNFVTGEPLKADFEEIL
jgi:outer membrane protein TolC